MFRYTDFLDCVGGMAKSVADLSTHMAVLMHTEMDLQPAAGLSGLRVGFTDPKVWQLPSETSEWPQGTRERMVYPT